MKTQEELLDRIAQLEEILGLTAEFPRIVKLKSRGLLRNEGKMLGLLLRRTFVPYAAAYDAIYGDLPESKLPKMDTLRTILKRVRIILSPLGISISNVYGEGYYLDQENKQKLLMAWPELDEHKQKKAA